MSRISDQDNVTVFHRDGGMIVGGEQAKMILSLLKKIKDNKVDLRRQKGVYVFDMWVKKAKKDERKYYNPEDGRTNRGSSRVTPPPGLASMDKDTVFVRLGEELL